MTYDLQSWLKFIICIETLSLFLGTVIGKVPRLTIGRRVAFLCLYFSYYILNWHECCFVVLGITFRNYLI